MTSPALERQITRLSAYTKDGSPNLDQPTRYFSQRDNYRDPHRTCNSSANAMYLDWLLRSTGREGLNDDNPYTRVVFSHGDTIYHENQTSALKEFGFSTKWQTDNDLPFVVELLETGFPVVCNILHRGTEEAPRGGHVVLLCGIRGSQFVAQDPYGTLSSGYTQVNGAYSRIDKDEFEARWQGGYRILA